jgi:hypothetical protein
MSTSSTRNTWIAACAFALEALGHGPCTLGHGTPIQIEVAENQLLVSGGWTDASGFAPMIFGEDDEDGEPFATLVLPQIGAVILWQLPGLDIEGMDEQSSLSIEPLLRPDKESNPVEQRLVWYWDPGMGLVSESPAGFHLLGTLMRSTALHPTPSTPPAPFLLADPIAGQQGFHNHGLISFGLDNDPPPPPGAYGFFARLQSDLHAPSDPFLVVFNHGVDPAQIPEAGRAINAAAFLPGDYNYDDRVDAADYDVWRAMFGRSLAPASAPDGNGNGIVDAADYAVWRQAMEQPAIVAPALAVPEPRQAVLLLTAIAVIASICRGPSHQKQLTLFPEPRSLANILIRGRC